jgi:hypothetical protein
MTVETASFLSQLDATYPASGDLKSEGDNHLRLIKSAVKATFPNLTAAAVTPSTTELNCVTGVTSSIQTQLNAEITARTNADNAEATARALADTTETDARVAADALKANLASPTFTGVVTVPTPSNATDATNKTYVDTLVTATAFSTALPSQTGNAGKFVTTNGTLASWGTAATLAANTFTAAQIYSDQQTSRAMLIDCGLTVLDKGNSSTTTQTLDYTAGSVQKITATGNFTIATSNWPPTGNWGVIQLEAVNFGAFTVTWPTISWILPSGALTSSISTYLAAVTGRTAFQTSGLDKIKLESSDAGTTIYGRFA